MLAGILGFVGGAATLQLQAQLPSGATALWLLLPLATAWGLRRAPGVPNVLRALALLLLGLALGFAWAAWRAHARLADALPPAWEGRDVRLIGVIASLPQLLHHGVRFELQVERVLTPTAIVPSRILVAWYGGWPGEAALQDLPSVQAGERWLLSLRLRRPHGTANPHGFDYEAWLLERGLRATGHVRVRESPQRLASLVPRPGYMVERLRERTRSRILTALGDRPYAGVIAALVMGDQRAIPQQQWTVFTRTGVNHLMSISGLHVTMIAALAFALAHGLWRRSARLCLRLPARRAAVAFGFAAALGYAALAGFAVPAQRTVYMLGVAAAALWLGRMSAVCSVLALAAGVVVLLDPWAALAPGFWLSFGAVALMLHVGASTVRPSHWALAWARTQWAVTLGLIPVLLALFQQVSLVSPLANAFAIPAISLVVVPVALVGTVLPFDFGLEIAHAAMALTMAALELLAALPAGVWQQHAPPAWTVAAAIVGIAWMLLPRGFPARWIGAAALAPLFLLLPPTPPHAAVEMTVLHVGQGLAVVVRTQSHALLYDAGPSYTPEADAGNRIVVPFLRAAGIRRLDAVVVSHEDNDHAGGAASVLAAMPVGWLASSLPAHHGLHAMAPESVPCLDGQRWDWDGVRFEMLYPPPGHEEQRLRSNHRSCVLRIATAAASILLTGDLEARGERMLLARPGSVRADVLIVPHHGSMTSSTAEFVEMARPRMAVFSAGYRNRFGHPRPEVVQRYAAVGSRILRSDRLGALRFEIDGDDIRVSGWRELRRRYWQSPPEPG